MPYGSTLQKLEMRSEAPVSIRAHLSNVPKAPGQFIYQSWAQCRVNGDARL